MGKNNSYFCMNNRAYYCNSVADFIKDDSNSILGKLTAKSRGDDTEQKRAWICQISELQKRLIDQKIQGFIIFEYNIVRMSKRIDVILLIRRVVLSLEFKNGANEYNRNDEQQTEDYAIDLKNFHEKSKDLYVCPILVATEAEPYGDQQIGYYIDKQMYLQRENLDTLIPKIKTIIKEYGDDKDFCFNEWFNSPYYPTPNIISVAVEAYNSHDLSDIARSKAGQEGIDACEISLHKIIAEAKDKNKKCVCFVTGVPGAGKTLVGLDVIAKSLEKNNPQELAAYITGNKSLVQVLREALKQSVKRKKESLSSMQSQAIDYLIQSSLTFKDAYTLNNNIPPEHIIVFDEAQRVWNEKQMKKKHQKDNYPDIDEPTLIYNIMNRHQDWAVVICLVGLGQDIHDGEIGINEWFNCGINKFDNWELYYSSDIFDQMEDRITNKEMIINCKRCHKTDELHLKVSARHYKASRLCEFVDAVLDNKPLNAKKLTEELCKEYPIYITRDYKHAKQWARMQVRGSQRCGVIASSGASRLVPEGIFVPKDIDVEKWFLADSKDLRSSNRMEVVASEFKVQGLEIDWAVVCWDADLRRNNDNWAYYKFKGTMWTEWGEKSLVQKRYLLNSYRVLLTRARQGMVIFVPEGVDETEDSTRNKKYYDGIYNYLISCGMTKLPNK